MSLEIKVLVMTSHNKIACQGHHSPYMKNDSFQQMLLNYTYTNAINSRCLSIRFRSLDVYKVGWEVSLAL